MIKEYIITPRWSTKECYWLIESWDGAMHLDGRKKYDYAGHVYNEKKLKQVIAHISRTPIIVKLEDPDAKS